MSIYMIVYLNRVICFEKMMNIYIAKDYCKYNLIVQYINFATESF